MSAIRLLLLVSLLVVQVGCGFQLRGTATLSDTFARTRITGVQSFDDLYLALSRAFELNGVEMVGADAGTPTAVVRILSHGRNTKVMGIGGTGKARAFQSSYKIRFDAQSGDGEQLIEPDEITVFRSYEYDPTEVLGRENVEAEELLKMQQEVSWRVVERLGAVK